MGDITVTIVLAGVVLGAAGLVLAVVAWRLGARRGRREAWRAALWTALLSGMAALLVLTLALPYAQAGVTGGVNLTPFQEIRRYWGQLDHPRGVVNLIGNVAVFVPVGALAAWLTRGGWAYRVLAGTGLGVAFSVLIELAQRSRGRVADIDDVILNGAGALVGALLAVLVRGVVHGVRRMRGRSRARSGAGRGGSARN